MQHQTADFLKFMNVIFDQVKLEAYTNFTSFTHLGKPVIHTTNTHFFYNVMFKVMEKLNHYLNITLLAKSH